MAVNTCSAFWTILLTVTFRQVVQADDVVFGRVELDFGLGFEGHFDVKFLIFFFMGSFDEFWFCRRVMFDVMERLGD